MPHTAVVVWTGTTGTRPAHNSDGPFCVFQDIIATQEDFARMSAESKRRGQQTEAELHALKVCVCVCVCVCAGQGVYVRVILPAQSVVLRN